MKKSIQRYPCSKKCSVLKEEVHPILQRVYANRGVQTPDQIEHDLKALLPYHSLLGIEEAVDLLMTALERQHSILIVGDYDVDGATSVALMVRVLRLLGLKQVDFFVPDRFNHGYGLTPQTIELILSNKPDLLITVDNGISSLQGVEAANQHGIKVIITDHHLAGEVLPDAQAIVNPNQPNDPFESKTLAGVGVAFYLLLALRARLRKENWFAEKNIAEPNLSDFLDLVALGTVSDMMPLDKNNRILVHQGLRRIRAKKCCVGVQALLSIANRSIEKVISDDLGYAVAPRLNAAGRLDDMSIGVRCLLEEDFKRAKELAVRLEALNQERRMIEKNMRKEALEYLKQYRLSEEEGLPDGLCLYDESWHEGLVGLLASRVKEKIHRPVIVFARREDGQLKGSGRSIPGLSMRHMLEIVSTRSPELITRFGGHAMAAGLTIPWESYSLFSELFNSVVRENVTEHHLHNAIMSDGELEEEDFSLEVAEILRYAAPWGQAFSMPLFDGKFRILQQRLLAHHHLKLVLEKGNQYLNAIAFNIDLEHWPNDRCNWVQIAYRLDVNEFRGRRELQLLIEHIEPLAGE